MTIYITGDTHGGDLEEINNKYDDFITKVLKYAPECKNYLEDIYNENNKHVGIDISIPNIKKEKIFNIYIDLIYDEMTIGYDAYEHDHFSTEMDGINYELKALEYIEKVYNSKENRNLLEIKK